MWSQIKKSIEGNSLKYTTLVRNFCKSFSESGKKTFIGNSTSAKI